MEAKAQPTLPPESLLLPFALSLFGSFHLTIAGQPVAGVRSRKVRALLAYLALARSQPVLRTTITELLWDGYTQESASTSLRQALLQLRKILPDHLFQADRQTLCLLVDGIDFQCDVVDFLQQIEACHRHTHVALERCPECRRRLQEAGQAYKGPLLEQFPVVDSKQFSLWLHEQRTRFATLLAEVQTLLQSTPTTTGNLPAPLTPLIGRAAEVMRLATQLLAPACRWLTLLGPGGIGKTRLALAVATQVQPNFPDGVWLVELAALHAPTTNGAVAAGTSATHPEKLYAILITHICNVLGLSLQQNLSASRQLVDYLRRKKLLLILDQFEQLVTVADQLVRLLQQAPDLRLLVTSLHRPNLQSQVVYPVEGLPFPADLGAEGKPALEDGTGTNPQAIAHYIETYPSLRLFSERAARTGFALNLDQPTITAMIQICRALEGSPLGIELAAALTVDYSLTAIAQLLMDNALLTATPLEDVSGWQRNLATVFQRSWQLLTATEQAILAALAVFHGDFSQEAALIVTGEQASHLLALGHKSLLRRKGERYALHELVRQFATQKLHEDSSAAEPIYQRFCHYYLGLLQRYTQRLQTLEAGSALARLRQEQAHIKAAWYWAIQTQQVAAIQASIPALANYYELIGLLREGEQSFSAALAQILPLRAELLAEQAKFLLHLADYPHAEAAAIEAFALAEQDKVSAHAAMRWGGVLHYQRNFTAAEAKLQHALHLYQSLHDTEGIVKSLNGLGMVARDRAAYPTALAYHQQALNLAHSLGLLHQSAVIINIGHVYGILGDYPQAISYSREMLQMEERLGRTYYVCVIHLNLGFLYYLLGDYTLALTHLTMAVERAHHIGSRYVEGLALGNLALLWHTRGHADEAKRYGQRALALGKEIEDVRIQGHALTYLGHIHAQQGIFALAVIHYQAAHRLWQACQEVALALEAQAGLAQVALLQQQLDEAQAQVEEILTNLATLPDLASMEEPVRVLLTCHQVLAANGDGRSDELLARAHTLLQERATRLIDIEQRRLFLETVPTHRSVLALWQMASTKRSL